MSLGEPRVVREHLDFFPFTGAPTVVRRREDLLLAAPLPGPRTPRAQAPLRALPFETVYTPRPFSPPQGVYESEHLRVEWQAMHGRQPFYHRNAGVDELSFQVSGERTLMTELGSVELRPGDFSRIPVGVSHDNYGRHDIHLLFYLQGPVQELVPAAHTSRAQRPPFEGWTPAVLNELITEGVGGPGQDIAFGPVDEALLLAQADDARQPLQVLRAATSANGMQWLYRGPTSVLGLCRAAASQGLDYARHLDADEFQYQVSGQRTLVTQRGTLTLAPGEFVCIPRGVAFTSLHDTPSEHLALASLQRAPAVAPHGRDADPSDAGHTEQRRRLACRPPEPHTTRP